jgi:hypothetical protein
MGVAASRPRSTLAIPPIIPPIVTDCDTADTLLCNWIDATTDMTSACQRSSTLPAIEHTASDRAHNTQSTQHETMSSILDTVFRVGIFVDSPIAKRSEREASLGESCPIASQFHRPIQRQKNFLNFVLDIADRHGRFPSVVATTCETQATKRDDKP